jgi:hypothetical protein
VHEGGVDQRDQLLLVAGKAACDEAHAQLQRQRYQVNRRVVVDNPTFGARALVGGRRELPLGQAVDAVVHDDVDRAPHAVDIYGPARKAGIYFCAGVR